MERKLSIIVPCHNSIYLNRLLDSILTCGLSYEKFTVILVDDNSDYDIFSECKKYENKLNINYYYTNKNSFHCPGNTREFGLEMARTEWVTFIDHDDLFIENSFSQIEKYFDDEKLNLISTNFHALDNNFNNLFDQKADSSIPFLHGKFYRTSFLREKNICFKADLFSQEDNYFNHSVYAHLIDNPDSILNSDVYTYQWIIHKESLSHSYYDPHGYREALFPDFLEGTINVYLSIMEQYPQHKEEFKAHIMFEFVRCYFFMQVFNYKHGYESYARNYMYMHELKSNVCKTVNISVAELIDYVYIHPDLYNYARNSVQGENDTPIIELQSFRDFCNNI